MTALWDEPLSAHTTFRIGGPADAFVMPAGPGDLAALLRLLADADVPAAVVGGGANLLAGDLGFRGTVVCTGRLRELRPRDDGTLFAGAGLPVVDLVRAALDRGLSGLEFAAGLPGSVGGAAYMNARCYDREMADALVEVEYLDAAIGLMGTELVDRGEWEYKRTPFMPGGRLAGRVVTGARFRLEPGTRTIMASRMRDLEADRAAKGHFDHPCAGSLFKNDRRFGRPTGRILDELGFRGRRVGDAMVSPKHANIFVNAGRATASDMMRLIDEARDAARSAFGFELEPEVVFLGEFAEH